MHLIQQEFLVKSEEFYNEINHRLIKIFSNILIPSISDYKRRLEQVRIIHFNIIFNIRYKHIFILFFNYN